MKRSGFAAGLFNRFYYADGNRIRQTAYQMMLEDAGFNVVKFIP